MRYFQKELVDTPLYLPTGGRLAFDDAGDDVGIFATDNPAIAAELTKMIAQRRGGLSEITQEVFEELKKKQIEKAQSLLNLPQRARFLSRAFQDRVKSASPAAEAEPARKVPAKSAPLEVPDLLPAIGQMWRPKEAK